MAKRSAAELFDHYYTALVYSLPIKDTDFIDKLLEHNLLPRDVKFKLEPLAVLNARSSYFLDNVIKPELAVGNIRCFASLLSVIKCSKHDNAKELAAKIEKELAIDMQCKIFCNFVFLCKSLLKIDLSRPLLKDLHNIFIPKVASDWYNLAIQLFNESQLPRLDEIHATYLNDR